MSKSKSDRKVKKYFKNSNEVGFNSGFKSEEPLYHRTMGGRAPDKEYIEVWAQVSLVIGEMVKSLSYKRARKQDYVRMFWGSTEAHLRKCCQRILNIFESYDCIREQRERDE